MRQSLDELDAIINQFDEELRNSFKLTSSESSATVVAGECCSILLQKGDLSFLTRSPCFLQSSIRF